MNASQRSEWAEEADRLRALPADVQRQVVEIHMSTARDKRATRVDRRVARERAEYLVRALSITALACFAERGRCSRK